MTVQIPNLALIEMKRIAVYTVKKVIGFPVNSREVTNQTLPGREELNNFRPGTVWLVTCPLGTENRYPFFTVYWINHETVLLPGVCI
jgi:hypothetical protein